MSWSSQQSAYFSPLISAIDVDSADVTGLSVHLLLIQTLPSEKNQTSTLSCPDVVVKFGHSIDQ